MADNPVKTISIDNNIPFSTNNGSTSKPNSFIIRKASDYTPRNVDWLWRNHLARRKFTITAGMPGTGKSTISDDMIATTTNGNFWPDNSGKGTGGFCLLYAIAEDDIEDTTIPRLIAAGANMDKVGVLEGRTDCLGKTIAFDPAKDFTLLLNHVREHWKDGIDLLTIDPLITIVEGNSNESHKVRHALHTLNELSRQLNCAANGIMHFTKNSRDRHILDRVLSSGAFTQVARIVLNTVEVQGSPEYWLVRSKCSNGVPGGGMSYSIDKTFVCDNTIETTRIHWNGVITGDANELIAKAEGTWKSEDSTQIGKARALLLEMLKDGPKYSDDIYAKAQELKISPRTVLNAKRELNVGDYRTTEFQSRTVWYLSLRVA